MGLDGRECAHLDIFGRMLLLGPFFFFFFSKAVFLHQRTEWTVTSWDSKRENCQRFMCTHINMSVFIHASSLEFEKEYCVSVLLGCSDRAKRLLDFVALVWNSGRSLFDFIAHFSQSALRGVEDPAGAHLWVTALCTEAAARLGRLRSSKACPLGNFLGFMTTLLRRLFERLKLDVHRVLFGVDMGSWWLERLWVQVISSWRMIAQFKSFVKMKSFSSLSQLVTSSCFKRWGGGRNRLVRWLLAFC